MKISNLIYDIIINNFATSLSGGDKRYKYYSIKMKDEYKFSLNNILIMTINNNHKILY
jgi:hypothetical protein